MFIFKNMGLVTIPIIFGIILVTNPIISTLNHNTDVYKYNCLQKIQKYRF